METTTQLKNTFKEVIEELKPIFPEITNNTYTVCFNSTAKKRLGQCKRLKDNNFEININKLFAKVCPIIAVKNTMVHEILHSLPSGFSHKGKWIQYANIVNHRFPHYHITRLAHYTEYAKVMDDQIKYVVKCPTCNNTWRYFRQTKMISYLKSTKNNTRYSCPNCKSWVTLENY